MDPPELVFIRPDWNAPPGVRVVVSTRPGGASTGTWKGLNLGDHVGDDPDAVARNRALLRTALALPAEPQWLRQVHGVDVVEAFADGIAREGDAAYTDRAGVVCSVLTADCLPVVLAAGSGREIAIAHCGWRGLAGGILAATVARFRDPPALLRAWLGPAIGPGAFEVGEDVRGAFLRGAGDAGAVAKAFAPRAGTAGKYLADLYQLARLALVAAGVNEVSGGGHCTVQDAGRFYSYRRDGQTGRFATLAWIDPAQAGGTKLP